MDKRPIEVSILRRLDEHGGHISDHLTHAVLYEDSGLKDPAIGDTIDYNAFKYLKDEGLISAPPGISPKGNYRITDAGRRFYQDAI